MSTAPPPKKPSAQPSAKLAQMLKDATPAQRAQAVRVAANLLAKRAKKDSRSLVAGHDAGEGSPCHRTEDGDQ